MYRVFDRVFRLRLDCISEMYFLLKGYEYVYCYFKEMLNTSIL